LIGEDVGVACRFEDFLGHFSGDLVLAVAIGDASDKDGGEDQGTIEADGADDIIEDAIVSPDGEGLIQGFGKAEVGDAGEILIDAVAAAGGQELLGTHQGELIPKVVGHDVLSTLAPIQGEQGHTRALAARFVGEHAAILVIGMSDDQHETGAGAELAQRLLQRRGAAIYAQRLVVRSGGNGGGGRGLRAQRGRREEKSGGKG
jgi:hypothetical protein